MPERTERSVLALARQKNRRVVVTDTQRWNYIRQIKRLQAENKILRSVVAEERMRRQAAFGWYVKRLNSKMMWLVDTWIYVLREHKK